MKPVALIKPASIDEAWRNLAADVLLLAIDEVRKARTPEKKERAREWLLSPAAELFFAVVLYPNFDIPSWVMNDCPILDK